MQRCLSELLFPCINFSALRQKIFAYIIAVIQSSPVQRTVYAGWVQLHNRSSAIVPGTREHGRHLVRIISIFLDELLDSIEAIVLNGFVQTHLCDADWLRNDSETDRPPAIGPDSGFGRVSGMCTRFTRGVTMVDPGLL